MYYRCSKSNRAVSCRQPYVREEELTRQFAEQLRSIELDDDEYAILRDILKQSHADEQRYRDEQLERLHRLKADLQKKEDSLLERLLDETITREVYEAKFRALEQERGKLDAAILAMSRPTAHTSNSWKSSWRPPGACIGCSCQEIWPTSVSSSKTWLRTGS